MQRNVLQKAHEVSNRLAELGLEESQLMEAVRKGMAARFSCTPNHPPLAPGFYGWSETVRGLRDVLMIQGWGRDDAGLLSLAVSPDGKIAIAVATGDEATGNPDRTPCTKSSKGPRTRDAVDINALQLHLFDQEEAIKTDEQLKLVRSRLTYWLLIRLDEETQSLRCELSTPIYVGDDGKIAGWDERIILGTTLFGNNPNVGTLPEERPQSGATDVDVQVKRRA
jgi:hypothetical protein